MRSAFFLLVLLVTGTAQAVSVVQDDRSVSRLYISPSGDRYESSTRAEDVDYGGYFQAGAQQPVFDRYADSYQESLAYGQLDVDSVGFFAKGSGFNISNPDETEKGSSSFIVDLAIDVNTNLQLQSMVYAGSNQYWHSASISIFDLSASESIYSFNLGDTNNPVQLDDGLNTYTGYTDSFDHMLLAGHTYRITAKTGSILAHSLFDPGVGYDMVGTLSTAAVPIPAAVWLFGSALAGLGWIRRKQTA